VHRLPPLYAAWLRTGYSYVPNVESFVSSRYDVIPGRVRDGWSDVTHEFIVEGRGGRRASFIEWWDITSRDDPYAIARAAEGQTIKVYDDAPHGRKPYSIPAQRALAYRGMSWEEWRASRRSGFIGSAGWYNLGPTQEGRTYFGADPDQAEHYASGFAPWLFQPAHGRPGIVVAIPKVHLRWEDAQDRRYRPKSAAHRRSGEMSHAGRVPLREVVEVWGLVAVKVKPGKQELIVEKRDPHRITTGSSTTPSVVYTVVPVPRRKW
jgi:hypothetical protein